MLIIIRAFSTSKPQSAFVKQYALKERVQNLSRGEIIFKVKGQQQWTIFFLSLCSDAPVFSPPGDKDLRHMDHAVEE